MIAPFKFSQSDADTEQRRPPWSVSKPNTIIICSNNLKCTPDDKFSQPVLFWLIFEPFYTKDYIKELRYI